MKSGGTLKLLIFKNQLIQHVQIGTVNKEIVFKRRNAIAWK
jgi:hypothetical protein